MAICAQLLKDGVPRPALKSHNAVYGKILRGIFQTPPLALLYAGAIIMSMVIGAGMAWMPSYFLRIAHFSVNTCGVVVGCVMLSSILVILILGPGLEFLQRHFTRAPALALCGIASIATITRVFAYGLINPGTATQIVLLVIGAMCLGCVTTCSSVAVLCLVEPRHQATANSIQMLSLNLLGMPLGALLTGILSGTLSLSRAFFPFMLCPH